jgi:hypothetical protein
MTKVCYTSHLTISLEMELVTHPQGPESMSKATTTKICYKAGLHSLPQHDCPPFEIHANSLGGPSELPNILVPPKYYEL